MEDLPRRASVSLHALHLGRLALLIVCSTASLLSGSAKAQTVVKGNVWLRQMYFPIIQVNHIATILQWRTDDPTAIFFDYDGTGITLRQSNLDEGSAWFAVDAGDVIGFETLRERRLSEIGYDAPTYVGADDFYLGVATTGQGYRSEPCRTGVHYLESLECRNVFGWLHVKNENGLLVVLDNAVAYDSFGIVVGTTRTVPEPSSFTILLAAVLLSQRCVRRVAN